MLEENIYQTCICQNNLNPEYITIITQCKNITELKKMSTKKLPGKSQIDRICFTSKPKFIASSHQVLSIRLEKAMVRIAYDPF